MIDEAFMPFSRIIDEVLSFRGEFVDEAAGVRSRIVQCEIESPVEMDITRDENGALQIGSVPPLYHVDTSVRPSYHQLRFTAQITGGSDAD